MRTYAIEVMGFSLEILESAGTGTPVFFCHGNSASASVFKTVFNGETGRKHRLIAMSFPGHGNSPANRHAYTIPRLGEIAAAAIRKLALDQYVLVGHSLGGHALLEAAHLLDDALGLMLISAPPLSPNTLADAFKPDPSHGALFAGQLTEQEAYRLAECFVSPSVQNLDTATSLKETILNTDPDFRPALLASLQKGDMRDEWEAMAKARWPIALLYGEDDSFLNPAYFTRVPTERLWLRKALAFKKCGHALHMEAPEFFNQTLMNFIMHVREKLKSCSF